MENTIMENNEAMEVMEEVVTTKSGKAVKAVVGIGLTALVGRVIYKRVIKPIIAKVKAKKGNREVMEDEERPEDLFIFDEDGKPIEK